MLFSLPRPAQIIETPATRLRCPSSRLLICAGLTLIALSGCHKPDEIAVYTVPKPIPVDPPAGVATAADSIFPAGDSNSGSNSGSSPKTAPGKETEQRDQLLGAIIPRGKMTWFFKLTGPADAVEPQMKSFMLFLKSIRFGDKNPDWSLPEGWEEKAGSEMRFATIQIATEGKPLELSVIPLPTAEGSLNAYLLSNVNRWGGQLGLGPLSSEEFADRVLKFDLNDGPAWIVRFVGHQTGQPMGGPPFAGKGAPPRESTGPSAARSDLPFEAEIPAGWSAGKAGMMQTAVYEVRDGSRQAVISVSTAGGDLTANVNRWRGQVQLAPLDPTELEKEMHPIKIGDLTGTWIEAVGPIEAQPRETILGVVVEAQGKQWFVKLKGDAELAEREKPRFEKFVQSLKFRGAR